jgi:amino acid transporter
VSTDIENIPPEVSSEIRLPERFSYRLKNKLLGPPIDSDRIIHERLGKPTALAVFASDNLSSSAYATEEILRVLIQVIGVAAFAWVVPVTTALLIVLGFLILSYRQTIKAYPTAGGAYVVTRDNFGLLPAQVAGVALMLDYILTVSVSVAAGTAALASTFSALSPYILEISIFFVLVIAFGNLRGVKESGKIFAIPTYFFILNMALLIGVGIFKEINGTLHKMNPIHNTIPIGHATVEALTTAAFISLLLHAFANGGAAVTGVEAISNGVSAFREPAWKNARTTLVIMGTLLGIMFLGLSIFAAQVHPYPAEHGVPTVISQIGAQIFGKGSILFYSLQAGTMLILILAANTSFADFPRLASFHAGDNFMPRQLLKRGHRLVFSNGIITLAFSSIILLLISDARVDRLIGLYAIGVFTSFVLSQSGMAKHHWRLREPGWRWGLFLNGTGALLSLIIVLIIARYKFVEGAWIIVLLVPIMVWGLVRLNRQYEKEDAELEKDVQRAAETKVMRHHVLFVLVDELDVAAARAMQYARTLTPDDLRAVHFDLDPLKTRLLTERWSSLGLSHFPLDIIECPDRRLARGTLELVLETLAGGETEVSVLIPRLEYKRAWHRLLHDQSAKRISRVLSRVPHCNVTIVPYVFGSQTVMELASNSELEHHLATRANGAKLIGHAEGVTDISSAESRTRVTLEGVVHSMRVQPWAGVAALECVIKDGTGRISIVFIGRRQIAGLGVGTSIRVTGVIGTHERRRAMLNPAYELLTASGEAGTSSH